MGSEITVTGPKALFQIGPVIITNTMVTSWVIMAIIACVCIYLTRNLKVKPDSKRQIIAEKIVLMVYELIDGTMGKKWRHFAPYIAGLFAYSFFCSMSSLVGVKAPTGDLSIIIGMATITFIMIQVVNIKYKGFVGSLKRFAEPVPLILPLNLISEVATPVSMTFRHFGNIAAGGVITTLLYAALAGLSSVVLKIIPVAFIQSIPIFQVGLPALLSIYFDVFTSFLQAYIFCMLTMVYVSGAAE